MKPEEKLRMIVRQTIEEFNSIADDEWGNKSNPSKWSKKQVLGHLVDSALTNLRRFVVTQYEQNQKIVYHQDEWVEMQNYQEADVRDVIELWRLINLQIARVMHRIPVDKLQNNCDTGKYSTEFHTLEFLMDDYVVHLKHHLKQIIGENSLKKS